MICTFLKLTHCSIVALYPVPNIFVNITFENGAFEIAIINANANANANGRVSAVNYYRVIYNVIKTYSFKNNGTRVTNMILYVRVNNGLI